MKLGVLGYRLILFVLALAGLGLTIASAISDSINRFYFHGSSLIDTLTFWAGVALAIACLIEGIGLSAWRRFHPPRPAALVGIGPGQPITVVRSYNG